MHAATRDQRQQLDLAVFEELRGEFREHVGSPRSVVIKQGGTSLVEHVQVLGLPLLGKTHASMGGGIIHVASVLGIRLHVAEHLDGKEIELVPGGAVAEAYRCCQIMEQVLRSCNASWGDLLRLTVHISDLTATKLESIEHVIDSFFNERGSLPITKTAVGCTRLRALAALQIEGTALLPGGGPLAALPPPPGLGPEAPTSGSWQCRVAEALDEVAGGGGDPDGAPRASKGEWVVVEPPEERDVLAQSPVNKPVEKFGAAPEATPEALPSASLDEISEPSPKAQPKQSRVARPGFVGQLSSLLLMELSLQQVQQRKLQFQRRHDSFFQVQMLVNRAYRTVRLDPRAVACQRLWDEGSSPGSSPAACQTWPAIWSYTFDVAVVHTGSSFINVGLVEWIGRATHASQTDCTDREPTLAEVAGACGDVDADGPHNVSESPRQIMLGCRKGVKWYGNSSWEHLFKDDICEGSVLRFQSECCLGAHGEVKQMRLWLLPSQVIFTKRGHQCVRLARPLLEWAIPPSDARSVPRSVSLWVPAVTLFSQSDAVVVAWRGGASGRA